MSRSTAGQVPRKWLVSPPSPTTRWAATRELQDAEVDDGSMHDPRTSTALRTLAQLTGDPPARRWSWTIGRLDRAGGFVSAELSPTRSGLARSACAGTILRFSSNRTGTLAAG